MITIIDYGLGNVQAFQNVFNRLNIENCLAKNSDQLKNATKIILPGVGSFDNAMNLLNKSGMREALDRLVLEDNVPVLGVCVGMQIMAKSSEEGSSPGLGWINAHVNKFSYGDQKHPLKLPHMGWNSIHQKSDSDLLVGITRDSYFYFLHSFYFKNIIGSETLATTSYGVVFISIVESDNIYGVQFHPEKSHDAGVQLLKNYSRI